MNEDTIRDIYYVEHKWNPHFFYLSPKSFCQDLEKNGSDLYLDLFHAMYQEESDYICPYTENDFSLRKELCNNGTTIIYQLITPSPGYIQILLTWACIAAGVIVKQYNLHCPRSKCLHKDFPW